ncbi:MAG: 16S rRNA (uracil(1498)-N(3))-methyltransferase [Pseudomonadota bacterium]
MAVRLYLDHPLGAGQSVPLSRDQAQYLFAVMRMKVGDTLLVFNGENGEWRASVTEGSKRGGQIRAEEQTRPQSTPPDLWLYFAPIKKARTDFIVEKATELGVRRICPVQTAFTNSERIRRDRLQAHAIEAAEQCGETYVPEVAEIARLDRLLDTWPGDRHLVFCDEAHLGATVDVTSARAPAAILIGPEGGFSDTERARLLELPNTTRLSLGPRILRADTAAVAAITLWQAQLGDWESPR